MAKVKYGNEIKTEADLQNLITGLIFRSKSYTLTDMVNLVARYSKGAEIVLSERKLTSMVEDTLDLVRKVGYEGAFTFIYSPREGTPAAKYPNPLTEEEKKERLLKLNEVINEGYLKGNQRFENKVLEVLVEGFSEKDDNMLSGYTENNKLVNFKGDKSLIGEFVKVEIEKAYSWHLKGKLIE